MIPGADFDSAISPTGMVDIIVLVPEFQNPGRITVWHGIRPSKSSMGKPKCIKTDSGGRNAIGYEQSDQTPAFCCKIGRARYRSRISKSLDWHRHDFVCAVHGRPLMTRALISLIRDAGGLDDLKCQGLAEEKAFC